MSPYQNGHALSRTEAERTEMTFNFGMMLLGCGLLAIAQLAYVWYLTGEVERAWLEANAARRELSIATER